MLKAFCMMLFKYSRGGFCVKKFCSIFSIMLLLVFSLSFSVHAVNIDYVDEEGKSVKLQDYLDTQGHWAHDTILRCTDFEWITGYNGKFMPNDPVKRGDLALIIDRMLGLKTVSYNFFTDLSNDAYYREALLKCVAAGYISGTGTNTINPNGYATREQVATIICRIFNINSTYTGSTGFADDNKISSWAKSSVYSLKRLGYMNGNGGGYVNPTDNISRAELVTMFNNVANTFIPKKDKSNQGDTFKNTFPTNVVTSRNITLVNSEVGRDLVLTQSTSTLNLTNSQVKGRILVLSKNSISLSNSKVAQITLVEGKTDVTGVGDNVDEVYVSALASESSLDSIPNKLILESGARIKVAGEMYENLGLYNKEYKGEDLRAILSDEQGYIVGGPKVSGVTFSQNIDNMITVSNVKISAGDSEIKEVGVIWLTQDEDEDIIIPLIRNKDGITYYNSDRYAEPFSFDVGKVKKTQAFRVYVKDKEGLYAYSETKVFTEYDYNITMKLVDNDYPAKVDVELIIEGKNIPEISSVRLVHDISEYYSETHEITSMRLYTDSNAEKQPDKQKYQRYLSTISSKSERNPQTGELEYRPSTSFGYIINFNNGNLINRFPILNNAIPSGYTPVSEIVTGEANYLNSNSLSIINNKVSTKYTMAQEVGVVYKTTTSESVESPSSNANGWTKVKADINLSFNEEVVYNVNIPITVQEGYTYYCSYVKLSNGYWYGKPKKILNTIQGDKEGPVLSVNQNILVLNDTSAVVVLNIQNLSSDLDLFSDIVKGATVNNVTDNSLIGKSIYDFNNHITVGNEVNSKIVALQFTNLSANSDYTLNLQVSDANKLKSNLLSLNFSTKNMFKIDLGEGYISSYGGVSYPLIMDRKGVSIKSSGHYLVKFVEGCDIIGLQNEQENILNVKGLSDTELMDTQVIVYFEYMPDKIAKSFEFTRVFNLK